LDPYLHLPHLHGRIKPAEQCGLRLTPEGLASWDQRAREIGRPPDWRMSDDAREADRRALLGQRNVSRDLWIYAYGSLMWDPGIHFAEVRLAELRGYQRRFTLQLVLGRGSPERPGLVLALEPQAGCCTGLAFRLSAHRVEEETTFLWRREMLRGGYRPLLLPMRTPQGDIEALAFTANREHAEYTPERSVAETAAMIAQARGILGSNRDYLEQLAAQLAALGIDDPYVSELVRHLPAQA
jgi:cation transport protein ChaC